VRAVGMAVVLCPQVNGPTVIGESLFVSGALDAADSLIKYVSLRALRGSLNSSGALGPHDSLVSIDAFSHWVTRSSIMEHSRGLG
jgi:hypothetical protein